MHSFRQDLRFALRQLRKSSRLHHRRRSDAGSRHRGCAAMFSVIYGRRVLGGRCPFPDPNRIVYVETHAAASVP